MLLYLNTYSVYSQNLASLIDRALSFSTWTDNNGRTVYATLIGCTATEDGKVFVFLARDNSTKQFGVQLDSLHSTDRDFVISLYRLSDGLIEENEYRDSRLAFMRIRNGHQAPKYETEIKGNELSDSRQTPQYDKYIQAESPKRKKWFPKKGSSFIGTFLGISRNGDLIFKNDHGKVHLRSMSSFFEKDQRFFVSYTEELSSSEVDLLDQIATSAKLDQIKNRMQELDPWRSY